MLQDSFAEKKFGAPVWTAFELNRAIQQPLIFRHFGEPCYTVQEIRTLLSRVGFSIWDPVLLRLKLTYVILESLVPLASSPKPESPGVGFRFRIGGFRVEGI